MWGYLKSVHHSSNDNIEELKIHIQREVAVIPREIMEIGQIGIHNVSVRFQGCIHYVRMGTILRKYCILRHEIFNIWTLNGTGII